MKSPPVNLPSLLWPFNGRRIRTQDSNLLLVNGVPDCRWAVTCPVTDVLAMLVTDKLGIPWVHYAVVTRTPPMWLELDDNPTRQFITAYCLYEGNNVATIRGFSVPRKYVP
jgi:hypothetical protein